MAEAKALLDFSDLRGECVIVEYIRDPSREIPPVGMSRLNIRRSNFQ